MVTASQAEGGGGQTVWKQFRQAVHDLLTMSLRSLASRSALFRHPDDLGVATPVQMYVQVYRWKEDSSMSTLSTSKTTSKQFRRKATRVMNDFASVSQLSTSSTSP